MDSSNRMSASCEEQEVVDFSGVCGLQLDSWTPHGDHTPSETTLSPRLYVLTLSQDSILQLHPSQITDILQPETCSIRSCMHQQRCCRSRWHRSPTLGLRGLPRRCGFTACSSLVCPPLSWCPARSSTSLRAKRSDIHVLPQPLRPSTTAADAASAERMSWCTFHQGICTNTDGEDAASAERMSWCTTRER